MSGGMEWWIGWRLVQWKLLNTIMDIRVKFFVFLHLYFYLPASLMFDLFCVYFYFRSANYETVVEKMKGIVWCGRCMKLEMKIYRNIEKIETNTVV